MLGCLVVSCALMLGVGCAGSQAEPPNAMVGDKDRGGEVYARYCALCHGDRGQGNLADNANSLRSPEFLSTVSDAFLRAAIAKGRNGTPMSAWGVKYGGPLEDADVESLITFIRGWQTAPALTLASGPIPGKAVEGAKLFAARCAGCHGEKGQGKKAPSLDNGVFQTTASDAFIWHAISNGRSGTEMPAFGGTLSDEQIDHLTAFIRSLKKPVALPTAKKLPEQPLVINPDGPPPEFTLRDDFYVPAAEVKAAIESGKRLVIVDARAPSDYLQVHIPGALSVPFYSVDEYAGKLPKDGTWIVAYCACPHAASGQVAAALRDRGFEHVVVLDEGIQVWVQRGYPIETTQ